MLIGFYIAIIIIAGLIFGFVYSTVRMYQVNQLFDKTQDRLEKEIAKQVYLQTQFDELQNKLSNNILTDSLTNLPSRKIFEDRLKVTLGQSERYQLTCGVMFLDLDGFKIINDALGYDIGDALLKEVADRLLGCIRQVDTLSRFSGDEFVFIFPQLAKAETAAYIAQRILEAVAQPFQVQGNDLYITASIGIAIYPVDGVDTKMLLKNADSALHQAKIHGHNSYQFYREEMHSVSRRELILSSNLRSQSIYQDFSIYYQPQVNIKTKTITSMVALLRWKHPDFGIIHLDEFIKMAENSGKMIAITEWMIRTIADHLNVWKTSGFLPPAVSIPVSLKQLEDPHFIHKVSHLMQEIALEPEKVIFEISETSLSIKIEQIEKMLHMMKHLGVRILIDNFGAGHLSLQHLRRLPVDFFKLDKSLIQDITINKDSESIVKMIVALAKSLNISLIAQGVESMKQEELLQSLGCFIVQGEIFGSPALASEFANRLIDGFYEKV